MFSLSPKIRQRAPYNGIQNFEFQSTTNFPVTYPKVLLHFWWHEKGLIKKDQSQMYVRAVQFFTKTVLWMTDHILKNLNFIIARNEIIAGQLRHHSPVFVPPPCICSQWTNAGEWSRHSRSKRAIIFTVFENNHHFHNCLKKVTATNHATVSPCCCWFHDPSIFYSSMANFIWCRAWFLSYFV